MNRSSTIVQLSSKMRCVLLLITISLSALPACKKDGSASTNNNNCSIPITGMTVTGVTNHVAVLGWTQSSYAQYYNVQYRVVGSGSWTAVNQISPFTGQSGPMFTDISGLAPGSAYEWQVQGVCGANSAAPFSASGNFTTAQYSFTATYKGATHTYTPDTISGVGGAVCFSSTGDQYLSGTDNANGTKINVNSTCNYGGVSTDPTITVVVNGITYSSNPIPNGQVAGNPPAGYYASIFLTFNATVYNPSNLSDSFAVTGSFVGDY